MGRKRNRSRVKPKEDVERETNEKGKEEEEMSDTERLQNEEDEEIIEKEKKESEESDDESEEVGEETEEDENESERLPSPSDSPPLSPLSPSLSPSPSSFSFLGFILDELEDDTVQTECRPSVPQYTGNSTHYHTHITTHIHTHTHTHSHADVQARKHHCKSDSDFSFHLLIFLCESDAEFSECPFEIGEVSDVRIPHMRGVISIFVHFLSDPSFGVTRVSTFSLVQSKVVNLFSFLLHILSSSLSLRSHTFSLALSHYFALLNFLFTFKRALLQHTPHNLT